MPELPEVEVVRRQISEKIQMQPTIEKIIFHRGDLRDPIPKRKLKNLEGAKVVNIRRRAKYLIFQTDRGCILSHLGMSGTWTMIPVGEFQKKKHDHIEIHLSSQIILVFNDPRRFGIVDFMQSETDHPKLNVLGPEPWSEDVSPRYLLNQFKKKSSCVKVALMNPEIVVGIGNIYASEILFACKIRPLKKSHRITMSDCQKIIRETRRILEEAIDKGGSPLSDFHGAQGKAGEFQTLHRVYGRAGENCYLCDDVIQKKLVSGRSTFWCSGCQS